MAEEDDDFMSELLNFGKPDEAELKKAQSYVRDLIDRLTEQLDNPECCLAIMKHDMRTYGHHPLMGILEPAEDFSDIEALTLEADHTAEDLIAFNYALSDLAIKRYGDGEPKPNRELTQIDQDKE